MLRHRILSLLAGLSLGLLPSCKTTESSKQKSIAIIDGDLAYFLVYERPSFYLHKCKASQDLIDAMTIDNDPKRIRELCKDSVAPITLKNLSDAIKKKIAMPDLGDLYSKKTSLLEDYGKRVSTAKNMLDGITEELEILFAGVDDSDPEKARLLANQKFLNEQIDDLNKKKTELETALADSKNDPEKKAIRALDLKDTVELADNFNETVNDYSLEFVRMATNADRIFNLQPTKNAILISAVKEFEAKCSNGIPVGSQQTMDQGVERITYTCDASLVPKVVDITCPLAGYERVGDFCIFSGKGISATAIAANSNGLCIIQPDQKIKCWSNASNIESVPLNAAPAKSIVAADESGVFCSVKADDTVSCWGCYANAPTKNCEVPMGLGKIKRIDTGWETVCAQNVNDDLYCWGTSIFLFDEVKGWRNEGKVSDFSVGMFHICYTTLDKKTVCVGEDYDNKTVIPPDVANPLDIVAGRHNTCALNADASVRCWGSADYKINTPTIKTTARRIDVFDTACAVDMSNKLFCWGRDVKPFPGDPNPTVDNISISGSSVCARTLAKGLVCSNVAVDSTLTGIDQFAVSSGIEDFACALTTDKKLRCFGDSKFLLLKVPDAFKK